MKHRDTIITGRGGEVRGTKLILKSCSHATLPSAETEARLPFSKHRRIGGTRVDLCAQGKIKCHTVWGIESRSSRLWPSLCSPTVTSHSMKPHSNLMYCNEQTVPSAVVFKKLTALQLVRKFPSFYEIRRFIAVFTTSDGSSPSSLQPTVHHRLHYIPPLVPVLKPAESALSISHLIRTE
jgi:hypothetical protein